MLKKLNFAIGELASTLPDDGQAGDDGFALKAGHSITTDTGSGNVFVAVLFTGSSPHQDTDREIIKAYRTDTNDFTITERNAEGTSSKEWSADANVMLIASAAVYNEFASDAEVIKKDGSVDYTGNQSLDFNDLEDVNQIDVAGYIELPEDGGAVTIIDLPQNTAVEDTEQSYAFKIDGDTILKVKALADGTGGIKAESIEVEGNVNLREGTAGAGTAPIKFKNGVLNTTPEEGALEYFDGDLYFTPYE